jgi:hypothetical protein
MLSGHAPVVMLALAVSLAACATPPAPETIATSQRTYQGVSAELVLDAAAEVIELADPYTTVERYPGTVRGEPDWWLFVLSFELVWQTWVVTAAEDNGAVTAFARFTSTRVVGPDVEAIEPSIYNMLLRVFERQKIERYEPYSLCARRTDRCAAPALTCSHMGRMKRMAAASLLEAEIVTAGGAVRIANACTNPDPFWGLKGGGGGSLGVVTRLTLRTHDLPDFVGAVNMTIKAASDPVPFADG